MDFEYRKNRKPDPDYRFELSSGLGLRSSSQGYGATDTNRQKYGLTERDDATGLDHTWWRKYENLSGRWTSSDPYTGSMTIADPQSFHRYNYTQNDPVNFIDPSGLLDICFWNIPTNREGFEEEPVLEGCIHIDGDFGLNPGIGGGPGGGGGPGPVPQKKQEKKKCKQDPNRSQNPKSGDIPEIEDYLTRAGLLNMANPSASLIDPDSIKPRKEGIAYTINNIDQFNYALNHSGYAIDLNNGFPWNGQHHDQVGGKGVDNRFRTGTKPDKLGRKSLQVVVGPPNRNNHATGYSDLDCSNPVQSPGSAAKHLIGK